MHSCAHIPRIGTDGDLTMRLLQLQLGVDGSGASEPLDFHPMMTVVSGLDAAARARVVAAITALPRGLDPGHDRDDRGPRRAVRPHRREPGDARPRRRPRSADPAQRPPRRGVRAGGAEPVAAVSAEQFLAGAPEGRYPDLDAARRQQRSARETLSILREAAERARRDHADAAAALRRARLGGRRGERSRRGRRRGGAVCSTTCCSIRPTCPAASAPAASRTSWSNDTTSSAARLAHVEQGLAELSALDMRPIEVLVDAIRNPAPSEMVPSERANQLADEFVALQQQVDAFEAGLEAQGRGTASALQAVEAARVELAAAERAMQKPNLSPDDVKELEAGARGACSRPSPSPRGGSAEAAPSASTRRPPPSRSILDRVGFPTWSAYVMGASLLGIDPMAEERLERARLDLDAAEAHWADVAAAIEADPAHRALLDRLEAVYLEAFDILGGDDEQADLEHALRGVQVPKGEVTQEELVEALAYQLEIVGLASGPIRASTGC